MAQRLSHSLPNASELLAQRVISLSRSLPTDKAFVNAARAFGRFDEPFLIELRSYISSHPDKTSSISNGASSSSSPPSQETRHSDPQRERSGLSTLGGEKHVFKAPFTSNLGLDRLAAVKRAEPRDSRIDSSNKRQRVSGAQLGHLQDDLDSPASPSTPAEPVFKAPSRPASSAQSQVRHRGSETPSHPGGLSDTAARRLEEHRRKRAMAADARNEASSKGKQAAPSNNISGSSNSVRSTDSARLNGDSWRPSDRDRDQRRTSYSDRNRDSSDPRQHGHRDSDPSQRLERRTWDSTPRSSSRGSDTDRWTPRHPENSVRSRASDSAMASTRSAGSRRWDETPLRRAFSPPLPM